jgi:RNA polymerase subunit RPABC4/transcription elongation factor Spt4
MAYDGPFDDERVCMNCGVYMKKVFAVCPNCGGLAGTGRFSYNNVTSWLAFVCVMAGIVVPILLLVILAASHHGGCFSC